MSLKNEIEKTMFSEGMDDRIQDIASLIDSPLEDVKARMKTLSFSDYIKVMSALKSKDASTIKNMMGLSEAVDEESELSEFGPQERYIRTGNTITTANSRTGSIKSTQKIGNTTRSVNNHFNADGSQGQVSATTTVGDNRVSVGPAKIGGGIPDLKITPIKASKKVKEDWSKLPDMPEKYKERDGLEGPIMTKSGKVVYYDPKEGSYYDPATDIYLTYDEWKSLDEAYSTGSQGPDARGKDAYVGVEEPVEPTAGDVAQSDQKMKTARTQAMQRLGRDNLGGATAAQTADAMDKAEQGRPLTPIQRQAMAMQAQNLDNLAMSPDTRIQFRNLLNRLRKQEQ